MGLFVYNASFFLQYAIYFFDFPYIFKVTLYYVGDILKVVKICLVHMISLKFTSYWNNYCAFRIQDAKYK